MKGKVFLFQLKKRITIWDEAMRFFLKVDSEALEEEGRKSVTENEREEDSLILLFMVLNALNDIFILAFLFERKGNVLCLQHFSESGEEELIGILL